MIIPNEAISISIRDIQVGVLVEFFLYFYLCLTPFSEIFQLYHGDQF